MKDMFRRFESRIPCDKLHVSLLALQTTRRALGDVLVTAARGAGRVPACGTRPGQVQLRRLRTKGAERGERGEPRGSGRGAETSGRETGRLATESRVPSRARLEHGAQRRHPGEGHSANGGRGLGRGRWGGGVVTACVCF